MTQQDKQLLLVDLCARLPYGVICDMWFERNPEGKITEVLKCGGLMRLMNNAFDFMAKPYLRPMSSMSKDEIQEYETLFRRIELDGWGGETVLDFVVKMEDYIYFGDILNWLNAHHFDYRGLIGEGLAFEAPEGMYNTKTE